MHLSRYTFVHQKQVFIKEMVKRFCSLGSKPRLHGAVRDKWEKSCKTSIYTSEGDYTFLKRQNTQFNYLLSWHVVVMKERVSNINRAKLTSQMGFRRGNPSAIHLHIKLLSSIWNKIHVFQPLCSNHPFIIQGSLICTSLSLHLPKWKRKIL